MNNGTSLKKGDINTIRTSLQTVVDSSRSNTKDKGLADDGGVDVSISSEASLQMDDAPTAGAAQLVSLWQNNLIGFRAERTVNWARRRDNSVAYLTGVKWGQA